MDNLYILNRKILYRELQPLWEALSTVNYAVIKGEALSQQIYGEPGRRKSGDIDILIDKTNLKLLETELRELGFTQNLPEDKNEARKNRVLCLAFSHQVPSFHKEKSVFPLNVDVNYDIFWGEYEGVKCSIESFLDNTIEMNIYGSLVKTLPLDKAFVQLILHHYKEMNSLYHLSQHNCIRSDMFRDIYDMIKNNQNILTVDLVSELCDRYLIGRFVYYMIYYTHQVFNDDIFNEFLSAFRLYRDDELLESYGLYSTERKKWQVSFDKRLDNNRLWEIIKDKANMLDLKKIELNNKIFS